MYKKILKKLESTLDKKVRKKMILNSNWFKNMHLEEIKIIHIDTPVHGNLGDHMIAIAGNKFFIDNYPDYKLYEITIEEYVLIKEELKEKIKNNDLICFIGGGHFGNLYLHHEIRRRELVESYPNNEIIFLPATLTFEGHDGKVELQKSKKIYEKHSNITIMCREEESFKFAKEHFNTRILLMPDMVNYLEGDNQKDYKIKQDVLFLLRKDKEKVRDDYYFENLENILGKQNINYLHSDTHLGNERVGKDYREVYTNNLLKDIGQSKIIITDRLHGMILGIISKKPVIAFNSLDGKVKKSYETWYKNLESVVYSEENNNHLEKQIIKLLNIKIKNENKIKDKLLEIIKEVRHEKLP